MPRGTPQIEVSFDIDANGILNVTAVEKSSGVSQNVEIKNDKSRLSKEDIERMTEDAEKYAKEDEDFKERVQSKNELEGYCFSMKSVMTNEKLKEQFTEEEIKDVVDKIDSTLQWIEGNQLADKDEFKAKKDELDELCKPFISKNCTSGRRPDGTVHKIAFFIFTSKSCIFRIFKFFYREFIRH